MTTFSPRYLITLAMLGATCLTLTACQSARVVPPSEAGAVGQHSQEMYQRNMMEQQRLNNQQMMINHSHMIK